MVARLHAAHRQPNCQHCAEIGIVRRMASGTRKQICALIRAQSGHRPSVSSTAVSWQTLQTSLTTFPVFRKARRSVCRSAVSRQALHNCFMMFPVFTRPRLPLDIVTLLSKHLRKGVGSADGIECDRTVHTTSTF